MESRHSRSAACLRTGYNVPANLKRPARRTRCDSCRRGWTVRVLLADEDHTLLGLMRSAGCRVRGRCLSRCIGPRKCTAADDTDLVVLDVDHGRRDPAARVAGEPRHLVCPSCRRRRRRLRRAEARQVLDAGNGPRSHFRCRFRVPLGRSRPCPTQGGRGAPSNNGRRRSSAAGWWG